jgi:hypothetical protein
MTKHDNFLADAVRPKHKQMGYVEGFKFGVGFFLAALFIALILAGLTFGIVVAFHLH